MFNRHILPFLYMWAKLFQFIFSRVATKSNSNIALIYQGVWAVSVNFWFSDIISKFSYILDWLEMLKPTADGQNTGHVWFWHNRHYAKFYLRESKPFLTLPSTIIYKFHSKDNFSPQKNNSSTQVWMKF